VKRFGIGRVLSSSIHELSEGEKQKVGLSSITMTDPKALIFDEPTANLDPESTEALASEIIRLKKEGKAILVVDHRLYWLAGAVDRVIVMEDGRMAEEGDFSILTPELCRRYGLRSAAVPDVRETLPRNEEASGRPVLAADAVTFAYKGKAPVFDDATFGIHPGITAVIGHNGAGKTTLARLLTGLAKPVKGGFLLGGKQADAKTLLASVSIVLQNADHQLHMKTVLGEVMSSLAAAGRPAEREDALPLLSLFHLESLAERHPQSLSGGQKQRLVIALAFAKDPDVIILDEPTSGLDGVNMRRIARALESMAKEGKAVLVITHDLELLKLCCERRLTLPIRNEVLARAA
jgi:energy-coupling factor transporter ATP-binding protein EcfA2